MYKIRRFAADSETEKIILKFCASSYPRPKDIEAIPRQVFLEIDRLWQQYSQKKFGLTIQYQIWQEACADLRQPRIANFRAFAKRVGWYQDDDWLDGKEAFHFQFDCRKHRSPGSPRNRQQLRTSSSC